MDQNNELKHLKSVLDLYGNEKIPFFMKKPFLFIAWLSMVAVFIFIKRSYEAGDLNIYLTGFALMIIGAFTGIFCIARQAYVSAPLMKPYINLEKVEQRVQELEK